MFGLGDYQYTVGTCAALTGAFDKIWGGLLPRMLHIAGPTHDWTGVTSQQGYRQYFAGTCPGQTTGPSALVRARGSSVGPGDFWSRDVGTWHLVGLPTGLWRYDPARATAMTATLSTDLARAKARGKHLLVAYHDPYFTSATDRHTRNTDVKPWVDVIDRYDVRVTLSASQHNYERSCPVLATGACTPDAGQGTTAFNVSTGGLGLRPFRDHPAFIASRFADSHGWLALSLHPDGSFAWQLPRGRRHRRRRRRPAGVPRPRALNAQTGQPAGAAVTGRSSRSSRRTPRRRGRPRCRPRTGPWR